MKKKIIGLVLILLTLGALTFWEIWGRVNLTYDRILVLSKNVNENTIITRDMLKEKRVEKASDRAIKVKDFDKVVGLETIHFIPQGAELYTEYFEESKFVTGEKVGKYVLSIPGEWLKSYPQTLKRGDKAIFYWKGREIAETTVIHVRDSSNREVSYDKDRLEASSNVNLIEVLVTKEQMEALSTVETDKDKLVVLYY